MFASAGKTKIGLLLIIMALVVVVLGLTWFAFSWETNKSTSTSLATPANNQVTPTPTATPTGSPSSSQTRRTTLTDPTGQNVLGEMVKESVNADDHRLKITIKLPNPSGSDFYAVWLTQSDGAEKKYLGKLSLSGTDYIFEYTSNEAEQNFDKIVVTSGPQADQQVENIVAEGTIGSQLLL